MQKKPMATWQHWSYVLLIATLALTGMAQMPIFKRYYIADIPGLGWLAAYFTTHKIHLIAAALLGLLVGYLCYAYLARDHKRIRLSTLGWTRVILLGLIFATGFLRMLKNLPDIWYSPTTTMLIDWSHLGFAMLLGVTALVAVFRGASRYAQWRD